MEAQPPIEGHVRVLKALRNRHRRKKALALFAAAAEQASQSSLDQALSTLVQLMRLYGFPDPSVYSPIPANLLYARLCAYTNRDAEALDAVRTVVAQVFEKQEANDGASSDYVLFHCKWILSSLRTVQPDAMELGGSIAVTVDDLQLASVWEPLLLAFPFDHAQAEQVDRFFASYGAEPAR